MLSCLSSFTANIWAILKYRNLLLSGSIFNLCFKLNNVIAILLKDWPMVVIWRWIKSLFWSVFPPLEHSFPDCGYCQMHFLCCDILHQRKYHLAKLHVLLPYDEWHFTAYPDSFNVHTLSLLFFTECYLLNHFPLHLQNLSKTL